MSDVYVTAPGGMTFHLIYDAAADAAPQSFRDGIEAGALLLSQKIKDQITVNLKIDYSGTGGGVSAAPDAGKNESYATVRQDLVDGSASTFASVLPAGTEIQGQPKVAVWNAQLKAFGLMDANDTTTDDGHATFSTDIPSDQLVGVALHELSHALGRAPYGPAPDIFDLFRFSSAGTRVFDGTSNPTATNPAPTSYFSLDGGTTKLGDYGTTSDPSDFLNSGVQGKTDAFNEFYSKSANQFLSTTDLLQLDALGFDTPVQTASSAADLSADIRKFDLASQATGGDGTHYLITLTPNATLTETSEIFAVNLRGADTLTIDGQGATLDGAGQGRGLFVYSGNVTIDDLTIANAVATGGNGGPGGGGGGAGLGGGLFVGDDVLGGAAPSHVTLNDVVFSGDSANGGNGATAVEGGFYAGGGGEIILAEGLPTESYLDCGNRTAFANGGAFVEAHPDFAPKHWADTCLPLIKQGPAVAAAKARLLARLLERGHWLDQQADVHVLVDGLRIDPLRISGSRLAFLLPAEGREIALCSKVFVPARVCADSSDGRDLGLAVGWLQIDGEMVSIDCDEACGPGWHPAEFEGGRFARRWTRGAAVLPPGARIVIVDLSGAGQYWRDRQDNGEALSA